FVAADVGLPHRDRQPRRPTAVQLAEARIAIPFRATLDVLDPQHRQGDVLAFQVAMNLSPIGLGMTPMALLGAGRREQRRLQRAVGHLRRQWPAQPGTGQSLQGQPDRRRRNADSEGNLVEPDPGGSQTKHFAHLAHHCPLCWHPLPVQKPKERTLFGPAEAPLNRATLSRNAGRNYLGTPGEIKSEWWATSSRIRGRLPPESAAGYSRLVAIPSY